MSDRTQFTRVLGYEPIMESQSITRERSAAWGIPVSDRMNPSTTTRFTPYRFTDLHFNPSGPCTANDTVLPKDLTLLSPAPPIPFPLPLLLMLTLLLWFGNRWFFALLLLFVYIPIVSMTSTGTMPVRVRLVGTGALRVHGQTKKIRGRLCISFTYFFWG